MQLLQVVRGGQFPELRTRPTLNALQRLARAQLMPEPTAQALAQAYVFLKSKIQHAQRGCSTRCEWADLHCCAVLSFSAFRLCVSDGGTNVRDMVGR